MQKLSVTLITLNEESNIRDCLESVRWADEVLVSDSGSADRTVEICKGRGAKVFLDEWLGFGRQKNLIAGRARNTWILNIDADERVTPDLRREIEQALEKGDCDGYYISRKNFFGKTWIRYCGWYPDYNLRLYRRDRAAFNDRGVHEAVQVEGKVRYLENPLEHYTYEDVSDYLARMNRYSTLAAEEMLKNGKSVSCLSILIRSLATFLKMFFLQMGFLEGMKGLVLSGLYSAYTFSKYAKLWELKEKGKRLKAEGKRDDNYTSG